VRLADLPLVPTPRLGVVRVLLDERPLVGVDRGVRAPRLADRPLLPVDAGVDGPRVLDVDRPLRPGVVSPTLLDDRPRAEDGVAGVAFDGRRVALLPLPALSSSGRAARLLPTRGLRVEIPVTIVVFWAFRAVLRRSATPPPPVPSPLLLEEDEVAPDPFCSSDELDEFSFIETVAGDVVPTALTPDGLGGRMVGVPPLLPAGRLGGRDVEEAMATAAATSPAEELCSDADMVLPSIEVLLWLAALPSNLGGRTGVMTASVMASIGARIHVAMSLQSGLADDVPCTRPPSYEADVLVEGLTGGGAVVCEEGALSRGASSLALALIIVLRLVVTSNLDTSTSSRPSRVNAASATEFSENRLGEFVLSRNLLLLYLLLPLIPVGVGRNV